MYKHSLKIGWVKCQVSRILTSTNYYVHEIIEANFKPISCKQYVNILHAYLLHLREQNRCIAVIK